MLSKILHGKGALFRKTFGYHFGFITRRAVRRSGSIYGVDDGGESGGYARNPRTFCAQIDQLTLRVQRIEASNTMHEKALHLTNVGSILISIKVTMSRFRQGFACNPFGTAKRS